MQHDRCFCPGDGLIDIKGLHIRQACQQAAAHRCRQIGLQPLGRIVLQPRVGSLRVQLQFQHADQHSQKFTAAYILIRPETAVAADTLADKNARILHPLRSEAAAFAGSVRILGCVRGLGDGDGHRGLPGHIARRVGGRIGEGIHTHLVFLRRVVEAAVLADDHIAPLGLAGHGEGQLLPLRVLDLQQRLIRQIFVSLHGGILRHRCLILLADDGNAHGRHAFHSVFIDGQISHHGLQIRFGAQRMEGHLCHLLRCQNVTGLQDPLPQHDRTGFRLRQRCDADARQILFCREIRRREAVGRITVHLRRRSAQRQGPCAQHCNKRAEKRLEFHKKSYLQSIVVGGIVCQHWENYS